MSKFTTLILCLIFTTGCASINGTATIKETASGVKFETSRSAEMSMEKDGKVYKYNSQAPSLISKIMGMFALGASGVRR